MLLILQYCFKYGNLWKNIFLIKNYRRVVVKNFYLILAVCAILTVTCGCTNHFANEQVKDRKLIEIQNSDYTFTYKTEDGDIIFSNLEQQLSFVDGISVIAKEGKFGLVNRAGEYVVEPVYDYMSDFHDGMSAFFIQDITGGVKIGYFNLKGEMAIEPIPADIHLNSGYSYDYNFYNGIAMYRQPQTYKYGYLDKTGKFIIEPIYQWAESFKGNLAPVTKGDKFGYINTSGTLILPYKFVFADAFSDGLAAVYDGNVWGYIDETGNYVIQPQFGSYEGHDGEEIANPFIDGYAAVYLGKGQAYRSDIYKGQFALIDKTGKILNGQKYDSLYLRYSETGKAKYSARLGDKFLTLDSKGNVLEEEKY